MKELQKIINSLEGNILGINIKEEKIKEALYHNQKIYKCDLLENRENQSGKRSAKENHPVVQIKNLKKAYRKQKIDYLLCNIQNLEKYMPYIWKDAFIISKKGMILYGILDEEASKELYKKCTKYQTNIEKRKAKPYTIFSMASKKVPLYKNYIYFFCDKAYLFFNQITDFLEK